MAKRLVKVKNIDAVTKNIRKVFNEVKREKKLLKEIGEFTVERIRVDARKGFTSSGGVRHKFPPLSPVTKEIRKSIGKNAPELVDGQFFKSGRSNVTLTGQLIKSLKYVVRRNTVFIAITGKRNLIDFSGVASKLKKTKRGKLTKASKRAKSGLGFAGSKKQAKTNAEVYRDLADRGFGFVGLDSKGQKRVRKFVLDEFRRTIKKIFK